MVPSITSYTKKDGTKRKHRYYVCSEFHNKGSSACKANSIKAYDAENAVLNRLETFLYDTDLFHNTIKKINKSTVNANLDLQNQLKLVEKQLNDLHALQEKYMEAFEQNLFPMSILQERLQKVVKQKSELEQKKNELSVKLSSSDSKIIPPDLIKKLLVKFIYVYKQSTRNMQKQLVQLLIKEITIQQSINQSRYVDHIELDFDFSEVNVSKTFTLIHTLYRETDIDSGYSQSLPAFDNKLPPYLQQFLPLFVVRFTVVI